MNILFFFALNFIFASCLSINVKKSLQLHDNKGEKIDDISTKLHHATTDPNSEQITSTIQSQVNRFKRQSDDLEPVPGDNNEPESPDVESSTQSPDYNNPDDVPQTTTILTTKQIVTVPTTKPPAVTTTKPGAPTTKAAAVTTKPAAVTTKPPAAVTTKPAAGTTKVAGLPATTITPTKAPPAASMIVRILESSDIIF